MPGVRVAYVSVCRLGARELGSNLPNTLVEVPSNAKNDNDEQNAVRSAGFSWSIVYNNHEYKRIYHAQFSFFPSKDTKLGLMHE
jgi:hypothetical protein